MRFWAGPGTPTQHPFTLPCSPVFSGLVVYTQGAMFAATGQAVFTNALDLRLGY